jgi:transposase
LRIQAESAVLLTLLGRGIAGLERRNTAHIVANSDDHLLTDPNRRYCRSSISMPPNTAFWPAVHDIFGAVCPKDGKGAALILPACNSEAMSLHLAEIAKIVAPGAHAILLVDQAGWHLSMRLVVPSNITIIALPPKCPELNPVENVWQFMRDNWLSNRVFKSYDDLVDHCCEAWNKLVEQTWRIMSIGLRQWAHGY